MNRETFIKKTGINEILLSQLEFELDCLFRHWKQNGLGWKCHWTYKAILNLIRKSAIDFEKLVTLLKMFHPDDVGNFKEWCEFVKAAANRGFSLEVVKELYLSWQRNFDNEVSEIDWELLHRYWAVFERHIKPGKTDFNKLAEEMEEVQNKSFLYGIFQSLINAAKLSKQFENACRDLSKATKVDKTIEEKKQELMDLIGNTKMKDLKLSEIISYMKFLQRK